MRITLIQLCCAFTFTGLAYANNAIAQELLGKKVTLELRDVKMETALNRISKTADVRFVYSHEMIGADRRVSLTATDKSLDLILSELLRPMGITYSVSGTKTILLKRVEEKPGAVSGKTSDTHAPAPGGQLPERVVKGTVTDEKGEGLPGVSVLLKGTTKGTVTDIEGKYSLEVPDEDAMLVFSFVGFLSQEIQTGTRTAVDVTMKSDVKALEELVVVGYGTTTRKNFTGSVGSVKLENSPVALMPNLNVLESLKGSVSGLNIGATNSAGGQPSMQIRGQNSISGSNDPLIVLDGVIFMGNLSDINPNDIASLDVLKDATSAAAYGSRSANGVIAITTKRGKVGKPSVTFNTSAGFQTWQNRPVMMKGEEWMQTVNARNRYSEGATNWLKSGELANREAGRETSWLDLATRTGVMQNYQVAVSGATEKVNYYLSSSFDDNKGIVVGDNFDRINLMGKVKTNVTDWLELGMDAGYSKRSYSASDASDLRDVRARTRFAANIGEAQTMSPYGVLYRDDAGNLEKYPYTQGGINPLWGVGDGTRSSYDKRNSYRLNASALLDIPWVKGLTFRSSYLANLDQIDGGSFTNEKYYVQEGEGIGRYAASVVQGFLTNANGRQVRVNAKSYVFDNILNYRNGFGEHSVDATLVATRDHFRNENVLTTGTNFAANGNTSLDSWGLHKAAVQRTDLDVYERSNIGYLGRVSYSYAGKYFFTGSYRRDGASVFGANKKWGNFWAAGLAWNISDEAFLKGFEPLNNLKVKFSWGQNGNQGIDPYGTLSRIANGPSGNVRYEFSNAPGLISYGLYQSAIGNDDLGWETTSSWNGGFESAWLNNRLFLDVDFYFSKTTDQIFTRLIPVMTGFKTIKASIGQVNNTGQEVTLRSVNIQKKDLNWSSSLTFWRNDNKLVRLYGEDLDGDGKEDDDIATNLFIGHQLNPIFGYEQDGIVQPEDTEYMALTGAVAGAPKYKDVDGVPGITAADRKILGYTKENFRLNLGNTLTYKNFDLYVMLTGVFGGNNRFLKANQSAYMTATNRFNDNSISKPYWTPENRSNEFPAAYFTGDGRFLGLQSRGFVRVQDVALSYRLSHAALRSLRMNNVKVFVSAKNLGTFTKWVGGDPEVGTTLRENVFPVPSTYSVGANFSF